MLAIVGTEIKHEPEESMKHCMKLLSALLVALTAGATGPAFAQADFAQKKNCMACHAIDKKVLGPAYKDVAAKYAGQKDAVDKLAAKVVKGGTGVWGNIPMPANPQVTDAEAKQLVEWILTLK
jgi:cytochrome c